MHGQPSCTVHHLLELPDAFERLVLESEAEGFEFVRRLEREWHSGDNRFARPGELLLGARLSERWVAVGGLNHDHHLNDPRIGRLRHVYVAPDCRNGGVGSELVRALLGAARGHFDRVRLRAATPRSDGFYARLGFRQVAEPGATHALQL